MKPRNLRCVPSTTGLFIFISACNEKSRRGGNLNGWKMVPALFVLCVATAVVSPGQTFKTLVNFEGPNGDQPSYTSMVQGIDGQLYGTAIYGGANNQGTVFKLTANGKLITLYSFCAQTNCTDGGAPAAGMVQGADGYFYGTTYSGGANNLGTVFKVTPKGALTTLHSFGGSDGSYPNTVLVPSSDGTFYGTTGGGGANGLDDGTVFKITPKGTLTTLYDFCAQPKCTDGGFPQGLIQASNGGLFGTTGQGGLNNAGTFFKITPEGILTTLYSFCSQTNCADGALPTLVVQAINENFYGTTSLDGANGSGTVFKITSEGTLTTLHNFDDFDGSIPASALIQATDGHLYGTTEKGGDSSEGTLFEITIGGKLTTLHSFGGSDGSFPIAGVVQATSGTFYGTTMSGGTDNEGIIFSLATGLGPFVETRPFFGKVGASVIILGTNLTGATLVTFNGAPATFKVVSKSEIRTTVPEGATTGKVKVTTPRRTLSSNVLFRVTK
jgi:uncharacterized repeat protein (TIGR03803 family)